MQYVFIHVYMHALYMLYKNTYIFTQRKEQSFCNPPFIKGRFTSSLACELLTMEKMVE